MLKRAGVGLLHGGLASAKEGSCAVMCPACPHPGINLREDCRLPQMGPQFWCEFRLLSRSSNKSLANHNRWTEQLFVMLDAKFRLKNKERGIKGPSLVDGLAYFVKDAEYMQFIGDCASQTEVRVTRFKVKKHTYATQVKSLPIRATCDRSRELAWRG